MSWGMESIDSRWSVRCVECGSIKDGLSKGDGCGFDGGSDGPCPCSGLRLGILNLAGDGFVDQSFVVQRAP